MAHIHELIDFAVAAYIVFENKVLLVDHKKLLSWMPVGGHIELHEDPVEALLREVREESGLEVELIGGDVAPQELGSTSKPLLAPLYMDTHNISEHHKHIGLFYFARATTDKVQLAEQEHNGIKWFTKEELEDPANNINAYVRFYAVQALAKLSS